jgi:hypothetical protein
MVGNFHSEVLHDKGCAPRRRHDLYEVTIQDPRTTMPWKRRRCIDRKTWTGSGIGYGEAEEASGLFRCPEPEALAGSEIR